MPVDILVARLVGGGGEEWDKCGAWEVIAGWWEVWMKAVRRESDWNTNNACEGGRRVGLARHTTYGGGGAGGGCRSWRNHGGLYECHECGARIDGAGKVRG